MVHLMHGVMYAKAIGDGSDGEYVREEIMSDSEGWSADEENIEGQCFMATTSKSPMTEKVHDLLISLNIY